MGTVLFLQNLNRKIVLVARPGVFRVGTGPEKRIGTGTVIREILDKQGRLVKGVHGAGHVVEETLKVT